MFTVYIVTWSGGYCRSDCGISKKFEQGQIIRDYRDYNGAVMSDNYTPGNRIEEDQR